jgi:hypothetical protein
MNAIGPNKQCERSTPDRQRQKQTMQAPKSSRLLPLLQRSTPPAPINPPPLQRCADQPAASTTMRRSTHRFYNDASINPPRL